MKNNKIDNGKEFDWGRTSGSYYKYRDIYPQELYRKLKRLGVTESGTNWLDLGTGTGIIPINLYDASLKITGIDISDNQIEVAKKVASSKGMKINFISSPAESTGLAVNSFNIITAAQCFMYFDKTKIADELTRIAKKDCRLIKIYMGWMKEQTIVRDSVNLVKQLNANWLTGSSMIEDMKTHLFPVISMDSFVVDIPFSRDTWHGRMLATRGVEASMNKETLEIFDEEHKKLLLKNTPEKFDVKHKIFLTEYSIK